MNNSDSKNYIENLIKLGDEFNKEIPTQFGYVDIISALEQFQECVRYLNTRRSKTKLVVDDEAAVQDSVYLILRPWIHDLVPEHPTSKTASKYAFGDFYSKSLNTIIEVKYIRDKEHGKSIFSELSEDIELYRANCEHLIFFIYDPDSNIPDGGALKNAIMTERVYGGKPLDCHLIVEP